MSIRCAPLSTLAVLVVISGAPAVSQAQALTRDTYLASADLQADLALLQRAYTELHPGLYRYQTEAEVAAGFAAVDRYFAADRTVGEAFLALTRLTAAIKCGHSYPNFWNQPEAIANALFEGQDKLPFEFRWIDRRMIVTSDYTPGGLLPRGTEVVRINGVGTRTILDSLQPLARADGSNDAKRVAYLEVQGRDRYHAFDILYPLVFPVQDSTFTLVVRSPGTTDERTIHVTAMTAEARRTQGPAPLEVDDPAAPLWQYHESDGLGVLRMPTWALFNSNWDPKRWTDSVLSEITARGVPDLVIDLRGNEGGVDAGNELLARFIDAPITLPASQRRVRYRTVPEDLNPILDTWDPSFRDWGQRAVGPDDSMYYRLTEWDDPVGNTFVLEPAGSHYPGRVWVLVGAVNSSATFQFALAVKRSGVGTLVGQPTGGNRRGINGGSFFMVRLPGTGFEVDLPLVAGMPVTDEPDAGVMPDILVTRTIADLISGADAEIRAVRAAIDAVP
jgi:hypothetical protein